MKRSSQLATSLVLTTLLMIPSLAMAQAKAEGEWCLLNSECASNSCSWWSEGVLQCGTPAATVQPSGNGVSPTIMGGSGGINVSYLQYYSDSIIGIINNLIVPVLMAVAFLYFLLGVYKYFIQGADSDSDRATGRQFVLWGVIGFVVIFSVWGLVSIVGGTFNLAPGGAPPAFPKL